jgi:hypothetical protein
MILQHLPYDHAIVNYYHKTLIVQSTGVTFTTLYFFANVWKGIIGRVFVYDKPFHPGNALAYWAGL